MRKLIFKLIFNFPEHWALAERKTAGVGQTAGEQPARVENVPAPGGERAESHCEASEHNHTRGFYFN